jgi:NAD+ kinase
MNLHRILLASKVSLYELAVVRGRDARLTALLEAGDPLVAKVGASHRETVHSRVRIAEHLAASGMHVTAVDRAGSVPDGMYDLVVIVGGDGTVLDMARHVRTTPVLAVNSSPGTSVGTFCVATAETFPGCLEAVAAGRMEPRAVPRIRLAVAGRHYRFPALNDVLFAHRVPAATSRYIIHAGEKSEEQRSSGVWISTGAGSTGAMLSAGGEVMSAVDGRLQFLVREPCRGVPGSGYHLLRGMVGDDGLSITSRIMGGAAYLDGRRVAVRVGYGERLDLASDAEPLRIFLPDGRW